MRQLAETRYLLEASTKAASFQKTIDTVEDFRNSVNQALQSWHLFSEDFLDVPVDLVNIKDIELGMQEAKQSLERANKILANVVAALTSGATAAKKDKTPEGEAKWGFDYTQFRPGGFKKFLLKMDMNPKPKMANGFIWSGPGIQLKTMANPLTGEHSSKENIEPDYASSMALKGDKSKVNDAVGLIHQYALDIKDESPNRLSFVSF